MYRRRRFFTVLLVSFIVALVGLFQQYSESQAEQSSPSISVAKPITSELASGALHSLEIKGRAPKTGYTRSQFGDGWTGANGCDTREAILARDLTQIVTDGCKVLKGTLNDPYTGKLLTFLRGPDTSDDIQIDHVVALSDAWQKGAQGLTPDLRLQFANDPLELLAVEGNANQNKGDGDAATWLPPNKSFRCRYVARQIAVKQKYSLWVTQPEFDAINRILADCPEQRLPIEN